MAVLSKSQMSEEDIKFHYITPAITAKWDKQHITLETKITDGRINLKGNIVAREKPKRADYVLYLSANNPIAIVEAKDNNHTVSHGLQQAMTYAQMLDVPFAFSSNGDGFAEHDFLTGKERTFGLDEFSQMSFKFFCHGERPPFTTIIQKQSYRALIAGNASSALATMRNCSSRGGSGIHTMLILATANPG